MRMTPESEIRALPRECQVAVAKYALAGWRFEPVVPIGWHVLTPDDTFAGGYVRLEKAIRTQGLCGPLP